MDADPAILSVQPRTMGRPVLKRIGIRVSAIFEHAEQTAGVPDRT
jgi:hypothetical protein